MNYGLTCSRQRTRSLWETSITRRFIIAHIVQNIKAPQALKGSEITLKMSIKSVLTLSRRALGDVVVSILYLQNVYLANLAHRITRNSYIMPFISRPETYWNTETKHETEARLDYITETGAPFQFQMFICITVFIFTFSPSHHPPSTPSALHIFHPPHHLL